MDKSIICLIGDCKNKAEGLVWNMYPNNTLVRLLEDNNTIAVIKLKKIGPRPICSNHMIMCYGTHETLGPTTLVYGFPN